MTAVGWLRLGAAQPDRFEAVHADPVPALDAALDGSSPARDTATVIAILRTAYDADGLQPRRAEPATVSSSHPGAHTAAGCMPT